MARQDPRLEAAEDELIDCWRMLHCVPDRDRGFLTSGSRSALPDPIRDRITDYPDAAAPRRTLTTREVARVNAMFDGPRCIIVRAVAARDMRLVETVIRIRASQPSSGFGWDDVSNALRGHLYEFGHIAPEGIGYLPRLAQVVEDGGSGLPDLARDICRMVLTLVELLTLRLAALTAKIAALSRQAAMPRQLQTMPGVGPIGALAIETFAPPMDQFRRGRDFAAWLGLVPRQHSSGGKQRLGKTSKMGQRDIRRLLVTGAMAVIRWAMRRGAPRNPWLARLLEPKPPMVAAFALANKMARGIWAMLTRNEDYRDPVGVGA